MLLVSLVGVLSLRFYIFYLVVVAITGSFLVGLSVSGRAILRNVIAVCIVGVGLTFFGALDQATEQIEQFANLEQIQFRREALSKTADSGFGADFDVYHDIRGALLPPNRICISRSGTISVAGRKSQSGAGNSGNPDLVVFTADYDFTASCTRFETASDRRFQSCCFR